MSRENTPEKIAVAELVNRIRNGDMETKLAALAEAANVGPAAIVPLAEVMAGDDKVAMRGAQEAIRRIAWASGHDSSSARKASAELVRLIGSDRPRSVRSDAMMLLRCVGGAEAVNPLAAQLSDSELGEEARMALERIPHKSAEAALRKALSMAPESAKGAIQQSLRHKARSMRNIGVS